MALAAAGIIAGGTVLASQLNKGPNFDFGSIFDERISKRLARQLGKLLTERFRTPIADTQEFQFASAGLRDALSRVAGGSRQRASDAAVAGGFFDGGQGAGFRGQLGDIDRGELESFTGGVRDILLDISRRRTQDALGFLGLASGAQTGNSQLGLQGASQGFDARNDFLFQLLSGVPGLFDQQDPAQSPGLNTGNTDADFTGRGGGFGNP